MKYLKNSYIQAGILPVVLFLVLLTYTISSDWSLDFVMTVFLLAFVVYGISFAVIILGKKLGIKFFIANVLMTGISVTVGAYLTFQKLGCGWEGCTSRAGFPFYFFRPNGIGSSSIDPEFLILDVLCYFLFYFVLIKGLEKYIQKLHKLLP